MRVHNIKKYIFVLIFLFIIFNAGIKKGWTDTQKTYTIVPEVQYAKLLISGRHVGYWRDEYSILEKGKYLFNHEDKVFLPGLVSIRKSSWEFDSTLRPLKFVEESIDKMQDRQVVKNVEGNIDYEKRLIVIKRRVSGQEYYSETEVPLPDGLIADGASDIILANEKLLPGKTFIFKIFVPRVEKDDQLTLIVKKQDESTGGSWLEMKSRENPLDQMEVLFVPAREGTPNGRVLKGVLKGGNMVLEVIASTKEEAIGNFEKSEPVKGDGGQSI